MKFPHLTTSFLALALFTAPAMAEEQTGAAQAATQQTPDAVLEFLKDTRAPSALSDDELKQRLKQARGFIKAGGLAGDVEKSLKVEAREARDELASRQQKAGVDQQAAGETKQPETTTQMAQAEAPADVEALLGDTRPISVLSDDELKQRLRKVKDFIQAGGLSSEKQRSLKRLAKQARAELDTRGGKTKSDGGQQQSQAGGGETKPAQGALPIGTQIPDDVLAFVKDDRPLSGLSDDELATRLKTARQYSKNSKLPADVQAQLTTIFKATRTEAMNRRQAGNKPGKEAMGNGQKPGQTASDGKANPDAEAKARGYLDDPAKAETLSDAELRKRLAGIRDLLAANQVSPQSEKALRQKLKTERDTLRDRLAKDDGKGGKQKDKGDTTVNIQVILADRRPPDQLSDVELRRRINVYRDAAFDARYGEADKIKWRKAMDDDRRILRVRLIGERDKRAKGLKNNGVNIQLGMIFDPGRPPPRDVFAAEVDDQQLEDVLVAPPRVKVQRRYTIEEVEASPELRDAMPRVEIDTIHFGFGEAYVREEEVENLDRIAEIMENILATHPREIFVIEGHTDAVGSDGANQDLSQQRAEAVKQALATYYVIPSENLETVGYGERYLKIPTPEPEVENRRVSLARGTPVVGELSQ